MSIKASKILRNNHALTAAFLMTILAGCSGVAQEGEPVGSASEAIADPEAFAPMALQTKLGPNPGKVLAVTNESLTPLTGIVSWADANSTDQRWQLVDIGNGNFKVLNQNSQQYISVLNVDPANSTPLVQWPYGDQSWHFEDQNDGFALMVNNNTHKPFGLQNASTALGAPALEYQQNFTDDQEWRPVPKGWTRIKNVNSGLPMTAMGSATNAANVAQLSNPTTQAESWVLVNFVGANDGRFRILNRNTNQYLGLLGHANSPTQPVALFSSTDSATLDELWRLRYEPVTGNFRIQNALSNKVLSVAGGSTASNQTIIQANDDGVNPANVWQFLTDPTLDTRVSLETFQTNQVNFCGVGHAPAGHEVFIGVFNLPGVNNTLRQLPNLEGVIADASGTYHWASRGDAVGNGARIFCTGAQSTGTVTVTAMDSVTQLATYDSIPAAFFCSNVGVAQAYHDGCNF